MGLDPPQEHNSGTGARRVRVHAGRIVTPVWSDLAPGTRAFTQDAWVGGLEAGVGQESSRWLRVGALGMSSGATARLVRYPIRDASGRVLFILSALVSTERLSQAWRSLSALEGTVYLLLRPDGHRQLRVPAPSNPDDLDLGLKYLVFPEVQHDSTSLKNFLEPVPHTFPHRVIHVLIPDLENILPPVALFDNTVLDS